MPSLGYEGTLEDFDPDDIRGKYTLKKFQRQQEFRRSLKLEFELSDDEYVHPIKESGRETSMVREFVRELQNK